jgi:hypothetical protein
MNFYKIFYKQSQYHPIVSTITTSIVALTTPPPLLSPSPPHHHYHHFIIITHQHNSTTNILFNLYLPNIIKYFSYKMFYAKHFTCKIFSIHTIFYAKHTLLETCLVELAYNNDESWNLILRERESVFPFLFFLAKKYICNC